MMVMSASAPAAELLDLKFLPAWVKEPAPPNEYSNFEGEQTDGIPQRERGSHHRLPRPERPRNRERPRQKRDHRRPVRTERGGYEKRTLPALEVSARFLPHAASLENVIAQIKSGAVAYSVFALARLFLEKPERYSVQLSAPSGTSLHQLGEDGPVSSDRGLLENNAFNLSKEDFYKIEVVQTDPIKGNFSNVARCRASGTLLGPTNHHSYQAQLRNLYEQRFSRRMSFADYQRQIEIVSNPAAVEQWKEQARNVTTYTVLGTESPVTFKTSAEAERHFRQHYLPDLIRSAPEFTVSGVLSRQLPDRALGRRIEDAWARETRSPTNMMQELAGALRQAGLNIFRHRRGMLFVSPIRLKSFKHDLTSVSSSISNILEAVTATPGIHRKDLAEKLISVPVDEGDKEKSRLSLAADLKWLISEGYVIEFNDGSLDLPRVKTNVAAVVPTAESNKQALGTSASTSSAAEAEVRSD
jgi:hypothetical protein